MDLSFADLSSASLSEVNLVEANLRSANLRGARLSGAILIRTDLRQADLTGCRVYGTSVWDAQLEGSTQSDLIVTHLRQPNITVDNLEVAQFLYLILNNETIRMAIDAITSKVVLILGRFTPAREAVLHAIRNELRQRNYLPVLFDFPKPANRDLTETISTLAHMSRFVIADITDAKSIPQELERIIPDLPSVPVQPLLLSSQHEYGMFEHFRRYPWVLAPFLYENQSALLTAIGERVIGPAEAKARHQNARGAEP